MKELLYALLFVFAGFALCYFLFPQDREVIVEKPVIVDLTQHQIDSLELAFRIKVKGEMKTKIFRYEDSATVSRLKKTLDSLKEELFWSLKPGELPSEMQLEYHTDSLGFYRDTLDVIASFVTDTISVHFQPRNRQWEQTHVDTVAIVASRGAFEFDFKDVAEIVLTAVLVGVIVK